MPRRYRRKPAGTKAVQANALLDKNAKDELFALLDDQGVTYASWLQGQVREFLRPTFARKVVERKGNQITIKTEFPDGAISIDRRKSRRKPS